MTTVVDQDNGEAGVDVVSVVLPQGVTANNSALNNQCAVAAFQAGTCPADTVVGTATARSPLLTQPLTGPVTIVVPESGVGLPRLGLDLQGPLHIQLFGSFILTPNGPGNEFDQIPDIPLSHFVLAFTPGRPGERPARPLQTADAHIRNQLPRLERRDPDRGRAGDRQRLRRRGWRRQGQGEGAGQEGLDRQAQAEAGGQGQEGQGGRGDQEDEVEAAEEAEVHANRRLPARFRRRTARRQDHQTPPTRSRSPPTPAASAGGWRRLERASSAAAAPSPATSCTSSSRSPTPPARPQSFGSPPRPSPSPPSASRSPTLWGGLGRSLCALGTFVPESPRKLRDVLGAGAASLIVP